ncbi:hypothetical protein CR513_16629, partial [Mucuna pruriens]
MPQNQGSYQQPNPRYQVPLFQQQQQQKTPPLGDLPSLNDFMKQLIASNQEFQQTLSSSNLQFQQNMSTTVQDLKMQVGQLANSISQLQSAGCGNLPSQPIPNPRGNASVVSLRNDKELQATPQQKPRSTNTESKSDADSQPLQQASPVPVSFPSRTLSARKLESDEELLKIDLEPTIQLANRSVIQPLRVLEDVLVQVDELIFPANFYVLDMETKIDVHVRTLSMEFGDTLVQFNIFEAMKHPVEETSLFGIDLIDELIKEYMQAETGSTKSFQVAGNTDILDCLGFVFEESDHDESWGVHDAKVTTALAHLEHDSKSSDSFDQDHKNEKPKCSKHLEVQVVGTTRQQSAQRANTFIKNEAADISRDWTITESTKADTNAAKEDWKQARIKAETQSANQHKEQLEAGIVSATQVPDQVGQTVSKPTGDNSPTKPPTELNPLPNHLKYAYLGDKQQFSVIIASNHHREQEEKLL